MRFRKGISPIVATVLMILIAIATGIVVYTFAAGWVGSRFSEATGPQAVLVVESGSYNGTHFILYVRNDGASNVNITRAYITHPNGTVVIAYYPPANGQLSVTTQDNKSVLVPANGTAVEVVIGNFTKYDSSFVSRGQVYTIKLVATDGAEVTVRVRA